MLAVFIIREKNQPDRAFRSGEQEILIGRNPSCDLVLSNISVSRHHACVARTGTEWVIQDLCSGNGTRQNGESVERSPLASSDLIEIGKFTLCFYESEKASLLNGVDPGEFPLHRTASTETQNTTTFQIPRSVLAKIRASEALINGAQVVQEEPPFNFWHPGEKPLSFGGRNGPPAKRLLGVGTAAIVHWTGSEHVLKRTARLTRIRVNGKEVADKKALSHGDTLDIGGSSFRYMVNG